MGNLQSNPSELSLLTKPLVRLAVGKQRPGFVSALSVVVGVVATMTAAAAADLAQTYPSRLVRIVSGFPPGGFNDGYAKSHPGKLTIASAGIGSAPHMYWELFRSVTGVNMVHVPYRGGGLAMTELLGGQVLVFFAGMTSAPAHIKTGKLKALAVTTAARSPVLPDVPAIAEHLPGYEATTFVGVSAPRGTPADIVERLNRETSAGVTDSKFRQRISDLGDTPLAMSTAEFRKLVADESGKWAKVIRAGNVKAE
jgi:tripartite-type tricarboxylate transporter receptor subunit TctC